MKIYLYVLDTLADWEISYILPELNSRRFFSDKKKKTEIIKISTTLNSATTLGGIKITPDKIIKEIKFEKGDILILPGAETWNKPENLEIIEKVTELINEDVIICAICGATVALADTGLLDNRKHTSNDLEFLKIFSKNYNGRNNYLSEPVVKDQNLLTASGLAPLEFSFEVLKLTNLFNLKTLELWYNLYKTKNPEYFHKLIASIS